MWRYDTCVWNAKKSWGGMHGEEGLKAMLKQKGEEGWELVTIVDDTGYRFYFKQAA
jgi:hypothetical protein